MPAFIDISNQRFGRLAVIERAEQSGRNTMWRCRCDCGRETIVQANNLRRGASKSCGCLNAEWRKSYFTTHGHANKGHLSPTYQSWKGMLNRCTNPNGYDWKLYGGRGITVCDRWRHSFENFLADMGERPVGYSIERIDVNGNYEPDNCKWIPLGDQVKNRRCSKRLD